MTAMPSIQNSHRPTIKFKPKHSSSTKRYLLLLSILIVIHFLFMSIMHIRHLPVLSEGIGYLDEGLPLHVISAFPRVPVMPNVLVFGERGSGVDVVS